MLVTFTSSTSREITMFADMARMLFDIVGKEGTARGVFTQEQLPDAIDRLKKAGATGSDCIPANSLQGDKSADEDSPVTPIGLAQRAHPLIGLMESTLQDGGFLMWQAAQDF